MSSSWRPAIDLAESVLADGQGDLRELERAVMAVRGDPRALHAPAAGRDLAYLTALLDALGLGSLVSALMEHVAAVVLRDPRLRHLESAVRNQLARALADRGQLSAASALLALDYDPDSRGTSGVAVARTVANLASVKLRKGEAEEAMAAARHALALVTADTSTEPREDIRLLALTVLVEGTWAHDAGTEAPELLDELENAVRQVVLLHGEDHPRSLSAVVTLASAEFESARRAADQGRMGRAVDVLAVVAQKTSATLGVRHPQAVSAQRTLTDSELGLARSLGFAQRVHDAEALIRDAAPGARPLSRAPVSVRAPAPPRTPASARHPGQLVAPGPERPPQQRTTAAGPLRGAPTSRAERQADAEGLRFSVLGPVRAWRGTEELPTGSPQQRALLAALLLRRGRAATASELIDALWGEEPPRQALAAMRTYATRLRKVLDLGVLASVSGGYVIRLPAGSGGLDLSTVEELWAKAERAGKAGDLKLASRRIEEALALWHGEPLANVPGPYAETQRQRLAEWRLQLQEFRLDIELQRGRQAEAVSELTALTAAHPLRERLRELLMLALYRSGRQAEALAVYADARRLLAEELGVDPSPGLQELEQRILQADAGLDTLPESPGELAAIVVRPAQLPAGVPDFTGRSDLVAELGAFLSAAGGRGRTVAAVAGIGGTGKTTLALHAAHAAASAHFPDGQLYVDLQGTEARTAEPETVLGAFLRALGTADSAIPDALEERSALYRSVLDGRRVLVVLDNARDVAQIRPLLPGAGGCATLITSRARMVDLAGAHLIDVDVMAPEEALELFARIVGEERAGAERGAALDVVAACGFLPLAIRIAASRLAARRTWTVSTLAAKLADERRRLDELQSGDLAVKATFELDYGALEPQQARAFRLLCLPDSPDISLTAAAAVLDLSVDEAEDILESLVDTSLLDSAAPGRYRYHDLVRLYARACAERDELPPARRDAALTRLLDFYGATAAGIYALDRPGSGMLRHFGHFPRHGLGFVDRAEATRWLRVEADGILACVQRSLAPTSLGRAANLLLAAADLGEPGVDPSRYESAAAAVRDAARDAGDAVAEGRAGVALIGVLLGSGRLAEARREAALALTLAESTADQGVRCWVTRDMGTIAALEGRYTEAEGHLRRGAAYFREVGDLAGEADAMLGLSEIHLATERADSAVTLARQGLDGYTRSGPTPRVAHARYRLGLALLGTHRYADAWAEFDQALQHFTANQQRLWEGTTHHRIAQVHLATRRPAPASQHAERALALGCVGGGLARADVLTTLGEALDALDQTDRARACWREALALYERAGAEGASAARDRARTLGRYLHGAGASPSRGSRDAG